MKHMRIIFPERYSPTSWKSDHEAGLKPDEWPYGLHHVAESLPQWQVSPGAVPPANAVQTALRGMNPRRGLSGSDTSLTWDEWTALSALTHHRESRLFSGVIWATDRSTSRLENLRRSMILRALKATSGLWCLSEPQAEILTDRLGAGAPPILYLRFGIDTTFYSLAPYPERPLVLSVGGDKDRDPVTLFESLDKVKQMHPEVDIVVQTSSEIPPPPGVKVIQRVSHVELRNLYRQASIVVVATRHNVHASGMTVSLEAQATGRPVVITRTPGIEDYIADGSTGRLAIVGQPRSIADAVSSYLSEPETAREDGVRGRRYVEERHRSSQMAASLASFVG